MLITRIARLITAIKNCEKTGNDFQVYHEEKLDMLLKELPHGGGFGNIEIIHDSCSSEKIVMETSYDIYNNGYLIGAMAIKLVVTPSFDGINLKAIGRFSEANKYVYGVKDYLEETYYEALIEKV